MSRILLTIILVSILLLNCGKNVSEVSIVNPDDNVSVMGYVEIKVEATDEEGIESVDIFIDDTLRCTTQGSPYVYNWNTIVLDDNSSHNIYAVARDFDKNETASDTITVTIKNINLPFNDNFENYINLEYQSEGGWWPVWDSETGIVYVDSCNAYV